jgi:CRISPR-associated protein Cmr1
MLATMEPGMQIKRFTLRMDSPAFLGDAEQNGRWRTPPYKAQLRQWFRVAWAAQNDFPEDFRRLREVEGQLFGNAWLDESCKSRVRLRLAPWSEGRLKKKDWTSLPRVATADGRNRVSASTYLGYGPVSNSRQGETLKANAAIQEGETALFSLAWPEDAPGADLLEQTLWLMHRFGTVGGRSRNGWGSYALAPGEGTAALTGKVPLRNWQDCLDRDWPHAIGQDAAGPLIWATRPVKNWREAMQDLASLKISLRSQLRVRGDGQQPQERHWLAYPVTKHAVGSWPKEARLPNQLRFKLQRLDDGRVRGLVVHLPHLPPPAFAPKRLVIEQVWARVHAHLDHQNLSRIKA